MWTALRGIGWRAALLAPLLAIASATEPARADGGLRDRLDLCHRMVLEEDWQGARTAVLSLLEEYKGDAAAIARATEIEELLRVCRFRLDQDPPSAEEIFGKGVESFDRHSRLLTVKFDKPEGDEWSRGRSLVHYAVPLAGSFSVSYSAAQTDFTALYFCYDVEFATGYAFLAERDRHGQLGDPAMIGVFGTSDGGEVFATKTLRRIPGARSRYLVEKSDARLSVRRDGKSVFRERDDTYARGLLAFRGRVSDIEIRGRVDRYWYRSRVAELLEDEYARWTRVHWQPEKELPAWLAADPIRPDHASLVAWPVEMTEEQRQRWDPELAKFMAGDVSGFVSQGQDVTMLPGHCGQWFRGLVHLASGRPGLADIALSALIEGVPEFAPAYLFRGVARHRLRDRAGATADVERAMAGATHYPQLHALRVRLHLDAYESDRAEAILVDAAIRGIESPDLAELRTWVERARRGPDWPQRFSHESGLYVVESDHGQRICRDTARALGSMVRKWARAIGELPDGAPKARVLVFATRRELLRFAGRDRPHEHACTTGIYLQPIRTLLLWAHVDPRLRDHDAQHEGFHQYAHRFVDDAPAWFVEGWAEHAIGIDAKERRSDIGRWRQYLKRVSPPSKLVRMGPTTFLERSEIHRPESDDLVGFLREVKSKELRALLPAYAESLRQGVTQERAYDVFAPHADVLDEAFHEYMFDEVE